MRARAALLLAALGAAALPGFTQPPDELRPGREVSLPPERVKDTFFAYVLGIIITGHELDVDNPQMRDILTEFKSNLALPFDLVARVRQHTDAETGACAIGLEFTRDVVIPIPFSLLFYHPGSITATRAVRFRVQRSTWIDPATGGTGEPVFNLALEEGSVLVDIDDWLEVLLSAYIEDTWIRHIVFFTWKGDWMGLLEGTGRRTGRTLRAYFDFTRNRIVFPPPAALDDAGKLFVPDAVTR